MSTRSNIMCPGNVVRARVDNIFSYGAMCHILDESDNIIDKCLMPSREMGTLAIFKGDVLEARIIKGHKDMYALVPNIAKRKVDSHVVAADGNLDIALQYINAAALVIKKYKEFNE